MKRVMHVSVALLAMFIVIGLTLPSRPTVERDVLIDAHAATVFALLNDFRQIRKWSSWLDHDPNAQIELSGPARGVGARISWDGQIVGQGVQTIIESLPYEKIVSELSVDERRLATTTFNLSTEDALTRVVWSYERDYGLNLVGRYFGILLDTIVGPDNELGLSRLKDLAENLPRADFSDIEIEQVVVEAAEIAYLTTASIPEATAISDAMGTAYFDVLSFIDRNQLQEAGAPLSITRTFSGSELVFDAGIPVRGLTPETPRADGPVRIGTTYGGPVIRVKHVGPYRTLGRTHDQIAAYLAALGIQRNGDAWESYISDPTRTAEAELLTYVYYPISNEVD